ncbi:AsmA family protein [Maridesulfovibrio hydrothermalis]|uniref:AsmA family protein n=1 Tax=Maridesulfovibrio hydrothermalis AM13 = DSM 14728 TaxID=1121451 RepID=L0R8Z8_9BACT|nr:AsmA family protein [Maridesulfovibrio hydrothermalis]CCO22051.1 AsmA family protein [Maridesulfovibrio hydrothermalis AM13 = DSM 14728]
MLVRVKKIFWILFILFDLCILGAGLWGLYYLESDAPRLELERLFSEALGREVVFEENLDLIFYPWLGIDTGSISVSAAPDAEYPHQLTVKGIDFKVRLLPLLHGNLEVDTIIVNSPVFRMDRGKDGKLDLPAMGESNAVSGSDPRIPFIKSITVRGVSIVNATSTYTDVGSGYSFKVSGVNVRTGLLRKDTPLAFDLSAALDADIMELSAKINIKGLMDFSVHDRTVSFSETSLSMHAESDKLLGPGESVQGIASLDFDLVEGLIDVKGLVVQGAGIRLSGSARCTDIYHAPDFKGTLKSTRFDPKAVFSRFTPVPIPAEFKDILNSASFIVDFHSTLNKTTLTNMVLAVDDTMIMGELSLKNYRQPWVEFDILADSIVLDPYAKLFGLAKNDPGQNAAVKSANSESPASKFRQVVIADLVRQIPCNGKLEVAKFAYDGIRLENTRLAISPGPKVASLSVGKGSYLDGDFALRADLSFDEQKGKDLLYLSGKGEVSPFSMARLPVKFDGVKFESGKAGLKLNSLTSQGKTPGELVRNIELDIKLEGKKIAAVITRKEVPEQYRNVHAKSLSLAFTTIPLGGTAPLGFVGRKADVNISGNILKPSVSIDSSFTGDIFCNRRSPDSWRVKNGKLKLSLGGTGFPLLKKGFSLSLAGAAGLEDKSLKLDEISLKSGKVKLMGSIDAKRLGEDTATANGILKIADTECAEIFDLFGVEKPQTKDPRAFDSVELDSSFQLNGENLNLRVNNCRLDTASAAGTFELVDFSNPVLNFVVKGDHIDVDRFLPPEEEDENLANNGTQSKSSGFESVENYKFPEWQFPDKFLGSINATGRVECNYFRIFDFGGSKASADVSMQNAVIDIRNIKADFHEGNAAGRISLGLRNGTVELGTDLEARGFQAGLFFADYVGRDIVRGRSDASLKISGNSTANIDLVDTLGGDFAFKITDGSYFFAVTDDKGKKSKKDLKPTDFSVMKGVISGKGGRFKVKNYTLKTDYLTATAVGGFSFPDDSIDLNVNADIIRLPNLYLKIVNALLDAITGVNVHVSGRLNDPKVEVKGLERWGDVLGDVLGLPEDSFMFFRKLIF